MKSSVILKIIALFLPFALLNGCIQQEMAINGQDDLIETSISISDMVSVDESPLDTPTKASGDNNDLIGIQVFQDGEIYAYGLFSNISPTTKIYLHSGKSYKFVCTKIKDGQAKIAYVKHSSLKNFKPVIEAQNAIHFNDPKGFAKIYEPIIRDEYGTVFLGRSIFIFNEGYLFPFVLSYTETTSSSCFPWYLRYKSELSWPVLYKLNCKSDSDAYYCLATNITNSFVYDTSVWLEFISQPYYFTAENDPYRGRGQYPDFERYYGELDNFVPAEDESVVINLKSVFFKLQCNISGITDGSVSLSISNDSKEFIHIDDISSSYSSEIGTYCFNNILDAWKYDDYTENLTVSMKWMRGVGIEQDLGSQVIQVKRNALNIVNIDLSTN